MIFLLRTDLSVLLRIGKTKHSTFSRPAQSMFTCAQLSHPPCPYLTKTRAFPSAHSTIHQGKPTACAHFTEGARHPPRFRWEGKLERPKPHGRETVTEGIPEGFRPAKPVRIAPGGTCA
jgi:hypothetical protein